MHCDNSISYAPRSTVLLASYDEAFGPNISKDVSLYRYIMLLLRYIVMCFCFVIDSFSYDWVEYIFYIAVLV